MLRKALHEENRLSWNAATEAHNSHKRDQARFFREGGSTLHPEEQELLGCLAGRTLVHLQCNSGQDTLSLARQGARVTGVDISDTAIAFARRLAAESGIAAEFERADVFDWFAGAAARGRRFDVAFSSYGAIGWLSDLAAWGRGIATVLAPGGRFVLVEFHPFVWTLDERWQLASPYFGSPDTVFTEEQGVLDYVAASGAVMARSGWAEGVVGFRNPHRAHGFQWTLADTLTVLLEAGLRVTAVREYPYSNGCRIYPGMREERGGRLFPPDGLPSLPLMFAVRAERP